MYDLAVIGGGPAGYTAAAYAASKGLNTVLFEGNALGGVCLNEGCIPTKTLLYSAKTLDGARNALKYGIVVPEASFDYDKIIDRKEKVVKKLVGAVKVKLRDAGVEVVKARVSIVGRSSDGDGFELSFESFDNVSNVSAKNLLVATGSSNVIPPIRGLDANPFVFTNREVLSSRVCPSSVVVIGGGVVGMEFASFYNSLGCEVTVVEMAPKILGAMDAELCSAVQAQYEKKGMRFLLGCKLESVDNNFVNCIDSEGVGLSVSADCILMSVGRRANVSGYGLESLGVRVERGIVVDEHMMSSVPGVYAAGDVTGFSMLAHTATREAVVAVNSILGIEDSMSYDAVPGVVYTNPEFASVGLTEEQAAARGLDFSVSKLPLTYSGRFVAENERGEGWCKMVVDGVDGRILGVHMLGNGCSEIVHSCCMAISRGMTREDFGKFVFPHPTVSEILKEM